MSGYVRDMAVQARAAQTAIAALHPDERGELIGRMADEITASSEVILEANARDISRAREAGLVTAILDRLLLDEARLAAIASALRHWPAPVSVASRFVPASLLKYACGTEVLTL